MTNKIQLGNPDNKSYWLNKDIVQQFSSKHAYPYVVDRVTTIDKPENNRAIDLVFEVGSKVKIINTKLIIIPVSMTRNTNSSLSFLNLANQPSSFVYV